MLAKAICRYHSAVQHRQPGVSASRRGFPQASCTIYTTDWFQLQKASSQWRYRDNNKYKIVTDCPIDPAKDGQILLEFSKYRHALSTGQHSGSAQER
jgi:hypothetical protein